MSRNIVPNTFLIGVQKAATTSLQRWIAQHPEICSPDVLKDYPFFYDDAIYARGMDHLSAIYEKSCSNEPVILQGCVSYIYDRKSLERIAADCPGARFLLLLRNPVDRALSAYYYTRQRGLEKRPILQAFEEEANLSAQGDRQQQLELSYRTRGNYASQIEDFLSLFPKERLCVLFFEDIKRDPKAEIRKVFEFLGVDTDFEPELMHANKTSAPRSARLMGWIYRDSRAKRVLVKGIFEPILGTEGKIRLKWAISKLLVTKKSNKQKEEVPETLKRDLYAYYKPEVERLESLLNVQLPHYKAPTG